MSRTQYISLGATLALVLVVAGCKPPPKPLEEKKLDYSAALPPGTMALRKLSPGEYPDFSQAITAFNVADLTKAIDNSLHYLAAPSSKAFYPYLDINHERAVASLKAVRQLIEREAPRAALDGGREFDAAIKRDFEVYKSIGAPDPDTRQYTGQVMFTAYCTPTYSASLTKEGAYQFPLYKRPSDLVTDATGEHAWRRTADGGQVPYYSRREIEAGHVLDGQELVWLNSKLDAYVIAVQGSARLRLTDGRILEVGYAGNNGREYASPVERMVADGVISKEQHTLRGVRAYFAMHPQDMDKYLPLNDRYIFFAERPGGPFGSLNVPVTPFASIATDKSVYPRAMPAFLSVPLSSANGGSTSFRGIMLDQDTGGGIRASGRCDIYMGIGEQAEAQAGEQRNIGELYYLAVKAELMSQFARNPSE